MSIFNRGLADPEGLDRFELLVFLVMSLETSMDMEGWDHFFVHGRAEHSEALRHMLREIGDLTSTEIVDDYADHLRQLGVAFPPSEFPCESCCASDRDWRRDFSAALEQRWRKVDAFLRPHGLALPL